MIHSCYHAVEILPQWKLVAVFADFISYQMPWLTGKGCDVEQLYLHYVNFYSFFFFLEFYIFKYHTWHLIIEHINSSISRNLQHFTCNSNPSTFKFQCNVIIFHFCIVTYQNHSETSKPPIFQVMGESDTDIQNCFHDTYPKIHKCAKFMSVLHVT